MKVGYSGMYLDNKSSCFTYCMFICDPIVCLYDILDKVILLQLHVTEGSYTPIKKKKKKKIVIFNIYFVSQDFCCQ